MRPEMPVIHWVTSDPPAALPHQMGGRRHEMGPEQVLKVPTLPSSCSYAFSLRACIYEAMGGSYVS